VLGRLPERLGRRVRRHQRHPSGREVNSHGRQSRAQIILCGHVHHRLVDEDRVEGTAEADSAHVTGDVLALGVERAADVVHPVCGLDEGHGEGVLHVRGVVAVAAAELEHLADRAAPRAARGVADHLDVERGLLSVFGRRRDDQLPGGKGVIKLRP